MRFQVFAIHDDENRRRKCRALDQLSGEEKHGEGFAAPCGPEVRSALAIAAAPAQVFKNASIELLHSKELRIAAHNFRFSLLPLLHIREVHKVSNNLKETFRGKSALDKRLHLAEPSGRIFLVFNFLPCVVVLEWRIGRAESSTPPVADR